MTRHSKNNTSSAVFTHAERERLSYGTQRMRCTADSLRPVTCCFVCLHPAREPNCCSQGHLACRVCFLESIQTQRETNRANQALHLAAQTRQQQNDTTAEREKQTRILADFVSQQQAGAVRSVKRPRDALSSYWSPQNAPSAPIAFPAAPPKDEICCHGGRDRPHPLSLRQLVPIHFAWEEERAVCPVCRKAFSNGVPVQIVPGCGHAACQSCHHRLAPHSCFSCSTPIPDPTVLITLSCEGTGFAAAGGITQVERFDTPFQ